MNPKVFKMIQVTRIRFNQLEASSTARWFREIIRMSNASVAAVTATIVEIPSNLLYMSFIMVEKAPQKSLDVELVGSFDAKTGCMVSISVVTKDTTDQYMPLSMLLTLPMAVCLQFDPF
jgi:hypothetical protein